MAAMIKQEDSPETIDTTEAFEQIFKGQDKFSSWEEFITLFEEFQVISRTVFKPRSGTCVNYVNERRVIHKIPEKFVYQTVKMICMHFGQPKKREDSKRKHSRYIGLDCEAYVKLSYKKGFLHITDMNLVHYNHGLEAAEDEMSCVIRKIRPVTYNDELDLLITQIVDENKVFEDKKGDLKWRATLFQVQDSDPRLQHMTQRMLKKRIQFLMDRYQANCDGLPPLSNDHMGIILDRMITAKAAMEAEALIPKKRGRKRKMLEPSTPLNKDIAESYEEYVKDKSKYLKNRGAHNEEGDVIFDEADVEDEIDPPEFLQNILEEPGASKSAENEMACVMKYWRERDKEERKLRDKEIELRRAEMNLRKREIELQQSKFEFERNERIQLLDLLKSQSQLLGVKDQVETKTDDETTEYIMLSDGQLEQITKGQTQTLHVEGRHFEQMMKGGQPHTASLLGGQMGQILNQGEQTQGIHNERLPKNHRRGKSRTYEPTVVRLNEKGQIETVPMKDVHSEQKGGQMLENFTQGGQSQTITVGKDQIGQLTKRGYNGRGAKIQSVNFSNSPASQLEHFSRGGHFFEAINHEGQSNMISHEEQFNQIMKVSQEENITKAGQPQTINITSGQLLEQLTKGGQLLEQLAAGGQSCEIQIHQ